MRMRARITIPQRRRIFLGCEGESERSYGLLLNRLADASGRSIYIDAQVLQPGGGDPLKLVEMALSRIGRRIRSHGRYTFMALLLDKDKIGSKPERDREASTKAVQNGLLLIWQDPCHEAVLLRHFEGCHDLRPQTSRAALSELLRKWPDYRKGMPERRLSQRLDLEHVRRAAGVEGDLKNFLTRIGLFGA